MKHLTKNIKLKSKHETGVKKKNFRVFRKSILETLKKKDEINYLKHATINIKYKYFRNREHETSNMKYRTENMKLDCERESGAKKKNFGVLGKSVHETLNK